MSDGRRGGRGHGRGWFVQEEYAGVENVDADPQGYRCVGSVGTWPWS